MSDLTELSATEARGTEGGIVFIPFIVVTAAMIYALSASSGGSGGVA